MRALSYSEAEASERSVAVKKAWVAGAKTDLLGGSLSTQCSPPTHPTVSSTFPSPRTCKFPLKECHCYYVPRNHSISVEDQLNEL